MDALISNPNRNWGCRIKRYSCDGIEIVSLENRLVRIAFNISKGADVLELLYKSEDTDFMWHSFNKPVGGDFLPTINAQSGNFMDYYAGGWQELFPVFGGKNTYYETEIGVHGEACIYPWDCKIITDTVDEVCVQLSLRTRRSPFLLKRTITVKEGVGEIKILQEVSNLTKNTMEFMWGHHPAFGYPFLCKDVRLKIDGNPDVLVPQSYCKQKCPFEKETKGKWPVLKDKDGNDIDISKVRDYTEQVYMEYLISNLEHPGYGLVNEKTGLGIRVDWESNIFKYIWVWGMYGGHMGAPWYGRAYCMGVEPLSSPPNISFEESLKNNETIKIKPGEEISTSMKLTLGKGVV